MTTPNPYYQRRRARLISEGRCVQCQQPNPRAQTRCEHCQRVETLSARKRRHAKTPPVRRCPECHGLGHVSKTCEMVSGVLV